MIFYNDIGFHIVNILIYNTNLSLLCMTHWWTYPYKQTGVSSVFILSQCCQVERGGKQAHFSPYNEKDFALREIILNEIILKKQRKDNPCYKRQNARIELLYPDLLRCQSP